MAKRQEVSVDDLIQLSRKLLDKYWFEGNYNIYTVALISLGAVNRYSDKFRQLKVVARIDIAIDLVIDILEYMKNTNKINDAQYAALVKQYNEKVKRKELPIMMENYVRASLMTIRKKTKSKKSRCC